MNFERIIEKTDLKKYEFNSDAEKAVNDYLNKDEFVEILTDKYSLLGIKNHLGKEVVYTQDDGMASYLRHLRDELGEWHSFYKMPLTSERQFNIHMEKCSLADHVRKKLGNINFNKTVLKKKLFTINQKLQKTHDRLQGVFIFHAEFKDLLAGFDSRSAVFGTKISNAEELDKLGWIEGVKKASLLLICPDDKNLQKYLIKNNCEKLKVGRHKHKNIWVRSA